MSAVDRSLADEVAGASSTPSTDGNWTRFDRWCTDVGLEAFPTQEWDLLRYLHAHHGQWRHSYAKTIASAVARVAVSTRLGPRVTA